MSCQLKETSSISENTESIKAIENTNNCKLNLCVELKPSILNKLNLIETPNIEKLNKLINSNLLKDEFNNKMVKFLNEKKQLEAYLKNWNKKYINVNYEYSKMLNLVEFFQIKV